MYQEGYVNTVANLGSKYKFPVVMHKHPTSQASHNDQNTWKTIHHSRALGWPPDQATLQPATSTRPVRCPTEQYEIIDFIWWVTHLTAQPYYVDTQPVRCYHQIICRVTWLTTWPSFPDTQPVGLPAFMPISQSSHAHSRGDCWGSSSGWMHGLLRDNQQACNRKALFN